MTLLIGVRHEEENTERVIKRLSYECLENKLVMLEIFSYPLTEDLRKMNSSFVNFWENLCKYILKNKGKLLFGENATFYYRVFEKWGENGDECAKFNLAIIEKCNELKGYYLCDSKKERIREEIKELNNKIKIKGYESDCIIPFIERDPHFARMVKENKPDIVILGDAHIPYLVEKCFQDDNYSLIYIPPMEFIEQMKKLFSY